MFWRFGFHNASAIDSLLDKEDVALEAILDEDDLLQECKAQNTRLIDYFQRVDVLQRLFAYVTGQIEGDEKGRFKYPYVATEVLCSEIWSIVETCINEQTQLLQPFWETVLDRSPDDMKTEMVMASHFSKINAVFLSKKPAEMFAFIRSQPSVVERLLRHIETPPFVDLIVRIIQLDEQPSGAGVLEWLSSENLMGRLIDLLSPTHTSDVHCVVAELIKGIISMAAPSPGAGLTEGLQNGPASNRFARELADKNSIEKLASYMLIDFEPPPISEDSDDDDEDEAPEHLPNFHSKTSSVVHSVSMVVELIRKNNSDFFEPYLFHTLRNRLIQVQQQLHDDGRDALERAMKEMVDRMGVVHLGPVLEVMMPKLEALQHYLLHPRSLNGPVNTTIGSIMPLTFERYRISELFAELLHCSNMSLLNRSAEANRMYDSEGRLQGGLSALEELAQVVSMNNGDDHDAMDEDHDDIEPALGLPITSHDTISMDSDDDMSDDEPGSSDDDAMEEIVMYDEPQAQIELSAIKTDSPLPQPPLTVPSSPNAASMPSPSQIAAQGAALSRAQNSETDNLTGSSPRSRVSSRKSSRRANTLTESTTSGSDLPLPVGEKLKQRFLQVGILSTLLDLFFEFPWNNFLHSAVYDVVHQILTGPVDGGFNRELAISLFRDARLMDRIVDGQKWNDVEIAKPKGVRLGYMGHLTLISEDVIMALERFPPDLRLILIEYAPTPGWDDYVMGRYIETKRKDTRVLGGGKPVVASAATRNMTRWKVDEDDGPTEQTSAVATTAGGENGSTGATSEPRGEFRRAGSMRPMRESSADFGPAAMMEEEPEEESHSAPHFARYLEQQMHTSDNTSDDEDDDDEGGWLSQSTFNLGPAPPVSTRHIDVGAERRPLATGFDDAFVPSNAAVNAMAENPFNPNVDDGFGPFSDSAAAPSATGGDPFTFSSSFSDESFDSESFGDFGDFQSASTEGEGELTPTTGSWTFASDSSTDEEVGVEERAVSLSPGIREEKS
ncbi:SIT4 phosphatase-associated protein-domain-containing protein [Lyophyllum atratum]|nr:SIT4 phosphatase-associated protein-domain-containing protein [Lyophyllum atratum]